MLFQRSFELLNIFLSRLRPRMQLSINLLSSFTYFAINILIGIWLVPYFIRNLGVDLYGFVPLANSFTNYINIIFISLNVAVSRYLTIYLQRNDILSSNKTFNTALFGIMIAAVVLMPIIIFISYFSPIFLNVPQGGESSVRLLFLSIQLTFLLSVFSNLFLVATYATNRLDLKYLVEILNIIIRTAIVILSFSILSIRLEFVGLGYVIGVLFSLIAGILIWRNLIPGLRIHFKDFDYSKLYNLVNMGFWLIINEIGVLLFIGIDLLVVNKLLGATIAGKYAAILQWPVLLRAMAIFLAGVISPILVINYARENKEENIAISKISIKIMGLAIALPVGLICGFAPSILLIWLGPDYVTLAPLMRLLVIPLIINLAVIPLFGINTAFNKIRIPSIVTFFMGSISLFLSLLFVLIFKWGVYGVAISGVIMLTLKNAIFTPIYGAYILGVPKHTFFKCLLPGVLLLQIVLICAFIVHHYYINSWIQLLSYSFLISLVLLPFAWLMMKNHERKIIMSLISFKAYSQDQS